MKILITGANGFLGKHFKEHYSGGEHKVYSLGRQQLDVTSEKAVEEFFLNNNIDIVLHTAVKGGRRENPDTLDDFIDNMLMFRNLSRHSGQYKLMINFGSGAEFDRSKQIENMREDEIYERRPSDFYGLSKNLITREINKHSNIINLRLFGCFGIHELPSRFMKNSISRLMKGMPLIIHKDMEMDFISIGDVLKTVDFFVKNPDHHLHKDLNLCYEDKVRLSDIAYIILDLTGAPNGVIFKERSKALSYSGDPRRFLSLGIKIDGLRKGIEQMIKDLRSQ